MENILLRLSFPLVLFISSTAVCSESSYWGASCTTAGIKSVFQLNDPSPFNGSDDGCASESFEEVLKMIVPQKLEFRLFFKINAKCKVFSLRKNEERESVSCINNVPAIYELPLSGNFEQVVEKLKTKYGQVLKTSTNKYYTNAVVEYSLLEKQNESHVALIKTIKKSAFSTKPEISYSILYINPTELQKWLAIYNKKINLAQAESKTQKNKATEEELGKIK